MARLSRISLANQVEDGEAYDPEVQEYMKDLVELDTPIAHLSEVNQVISSMISGQVEPLAKKVLNAFIADWLDQLDQIKGLETKIKAHEKKESQLYRELGVAQQTLREYEQKLAETVKERDTIRVQRMVSEVPSNSSAISGSTSTTIKKFKGDAFDGKPENLERFKNGVRMDIRLYPNAFPNEAVKVAYMISGFGPKPDAWVQQFHRHDPDGVLDDFAKFVQKLEKHFGDPNFIANQQTKLVTLRQKTDDDIIDHISTFEVLCADAGWPEETRATLFKESLLPSLASKLRMSEVDQKDYEALRQKAIIYDHEFQESKKRGAGPRSKEPKATGNGNGIAAAKPLDLSKGHPGRRLTPDELDALRKEGCCFRCFEKGHMTPTCTKPANRPTTPTRGVAAVTDEKKELENDQTQ